MSWQRARHMALWEAGEGSTLPGCPGSGGLAIVLKVK